MEEDVKCGECGATPQQIISWKGMWRCPDCDEKRRRRDIEASGTVIDDDGVTCDGCLFGIKFSEMCVVDPHGDGPYHYNCAVANCGDPTKIRIASAEFAVLSQDDFKHYGKEVKPRKVN